MEPRNLTEGDVLALYEEWSEEMYAASFMSPHPSDMPRFIRWVRERPETRVAEADYEHKMLRLFREALDAEPGRVE